MKQNSYPTLNKEVFSVKTDSNGIAEVQANIKKAGNYPVAISFGEDDVYGLPSHFIVKLNKQKPKLTAKKKTSLLFSFFNIKYFNQELHIRVHI